LAVALKKELTALAFTKQLYEQVFNLDIKRNSRDIFSMVSPVKKMSLKKAIWFSLKYTAAAYHT
jgi:hypothetical protein